MNNLTTTTTIHHTQTLIAIDVAKDSLEVRTDESSFSLENSPRGFKALLRKVPQKTELLVVFEATGGYERALAEFLHERKIALSIINPRLLRSFARSEGIKAKTDPIDAKLIYRFARSKVLRITPAPSAGQRELSDLLDRRSQLSEFLAREQNRIQKALPKALLSSLRRNMKALEKEIALIEKHIRALVESTPDLKKHHAIITSVKGVGDITAWTLLAQLPEITSFSRNQLVALGYPIIYKAIPGLGHAGHPDAAALGFEFFRFALLQKCKRESLNADLAKKVRSESNGVTEPWVEEFKPPVFYGDIVNQEMYPLTQVDMIPKGFRIALPTKELAVIWAKDK